MSSENCKETCDESCADCPAYGVDKQATAAITAIRDKSGRIFIGSGEDVSDEIFAG
jgi:hypothetical protein